MQCCTPVKRIPKWTLEYNKNLSVDNHTPATGAVMYRSLTAREDYVVHGTPPTDIDGTLFFSTLYNPTPGQVIGDSTSLISPFNIVIHHVEATIRGRGTAIVLPFDITFDFFILSNSEGACTYTTPLSTSTPTYSYVLESGDYPGSNTTYSDVGANAQPGVVYLLPTVNVPLNIPISSGSSWTTIVRMTYPGTSNDFTDQFNNNFTLDVTYILSSQ